MNRNVSIHPRPAPRNIILPNRPGEAPCPVCGAETNFHGEQRVVWCPACDWTRRLNADDGWEYTKAILGMSRMNRGAFLALLQGGR